MLGIPLLNLEDGAWRYAIIGGLASIPLSLGYYWLSGMGNSFSTLPVFFGGLLAGYLAQKSSRKPSTVGIGAGIVGGLPGYLLISPRLIQTATDFATVGSSLLWAVILLAFFIPVIIAVAALPGWIGGVVGGWWAKKTERTQIAAVNS